MLPNNSDRVAAQFHNYEQYEEYPFTSPYPLSPAHAAVINSTFGVVEITKIK